MRTPFLASLLLLIAPLASGAPTFRLGDLATPRSYEARIAASPGEDAFLGEIRIALVFNRATPELWLNAKDLVIDSARIAQGLSLIHISEPTRLLSISYAVFCLK